VSVKRGIEKEVNMETHFTFRNMEPSDSAKEHVLKKMKKFQKYLIKPTRSTVILSTDRFLKQCEIAVIDNGHEYVGVESNQDMYVAIDKAVDKITTQLKKAKEKIKDHKKS
jgi:putative sigma-54 modulation protein